MFIFTNFFTVIILIGIITRVSNYFFSKYIKEKQSIFSASYLIGGPLVCFAGCFLAGFDVVISEYVLSFILWFVFDLVRADAEKEK